MAYIDYCTCKTHAGICGRHVPCPFPSHELKQAHHTKKGKVDPHICIFRPDVFSEVCGIANCQRTAHRAHLQLTSKKRPRSHVIPHKIYTDPPHPQPIPIPKLEIGTLIKKYTDFYNIHRMEVKNIPLLISKARYTKDTIFFELMKSNPTDPILKHPIGKESISRFVEGLTTTLTTMEGMLGNILAKSIINKKS